MKITAIATCIVMLPMVSGAKQLCDYVNPFIGTTNYAACNPGALVPNGMMSVSPFNVTGSMLNRVDKDSCWWSTPYEHTNSVVTGFSHVNLSGVGCPEVGSLLVMATTGPLDVDINEYGSSYGDETATPGYYSTTLDRYGITAQVTATTRTSRLRFSSQLPLNILLNLAQGLTNESGATVTRIADNKWEGSKLMGTFCYNPQVVFPLYFAMEIMEQPRCAGYWKRQPQLGQVEAQWMPGGDERYKIYASYNGPMSGDDIGVYAQMPESIHTVEVKIGISFASIQAAWQNLEAEQPDNITFEQLASQARQQWEKELSTIQVEGGTEEDKTIFYTSLYHALIHPSIISDNGEEDRYSVFSLWDTYRTLHPLLCMAYPQKQLSMVKSVLDFADKNGFLPRWELFGQETLTMEGDPAIIMITDSYLRGVKNFDINHAYQLMLNNATKPSILRPDFNDYDSLGYVPLSSPRDNSVSHALEYYVADAALSQLASHLGHTEDAHFFKERSLGYKHYFDPSTSLLRPKLPDGTFLSPFLPEDGANFTDAPGFHEGSAYNYAFAVPHDLVGLAELMGGKEIFLANLKHIFDRGYYDPANEPDIAYPFIFARFGDEAATSDLAHALLRKYYSTQPEGLPGNDDTGTLSAWAVFTMMGCYPIVPSAGEYVYFQPIFSSVTINGQPLKRP